MWPWTKPSTPSPPSLTPSSAPTIPLIVARLERLEAQMALLLQQQTLIHSALKSAGQWPFTLPWGPTPLADGAPGSTPPTTPPRRKRTDADVRQRGLAPSKPASAPPDETLPPLPPMPMPSADGA